MNKNTFYQAIQISTLPLFTDEQILDFVTENLLKQGCKSIFKGKLTQCQDAEVSCMYRGENGAKCAFGFLMADNEYTSDFENRMGTSILVDNFPEVNKLLGNKTKDLISNLQNIHDYNDVSEWKNELFKLSNSI